MQSMFVDMDLSFIHSALTASRHKHDPSLGGEAEAEVFREECRISARF